MHLWKQTDNFSKPLYLLAENSSAEKNLRKEHTSDVCSNGRFSFNEQLTFCKALSFSRHGKEFS